MVNIFLILFVACVINSMCSAQRTAVGRLKTEVRQLKGKTDSLQTEVDNIWIEVNDIWAEVSVPGRIAQDYNNRTGTDGLDSSNNQNFKTNKTVDIVQDLKVEVKNLVLTARDGLKTEKHWQRETVKNLTELFDDFKTGMTEESIVVNDQLERMDNESANTHKYCEKIRREMETSNAETNERMRELRKELEAQGVINEQMNKILDDLGVNQHKLESENHALSQTIQEMQNDNENIKTENHALSQTIQEMQNDDENIKTENKALSETIVEMQTKLTKLEDTLSSTMATKAALHHVHLCDEGWQIFHGHCYLVVNKGKPWDDALAYCENLNSSLVEIRTDEEREFVFELLGDNNRYGYWTGATDRAAEGRFVYQRCKQLVPDKNWYPGQPNNWGGDEHCLNMNRKYENRLHFFDSSCNKQYRFICVKP